MQFEYLVILAAVLALAYAAYKARGIMAIEVKNEKAKEIANAIREGAMAFFDA